MRCFSIRFPTFPGDFQTRRERFRRCWAASRHAEFNGEGRRGCWSENKKGGRKAPYVSEKDFVFLNHERRWGWGGVVGKSRSSLPADPAGLCGTLTSLSLYTQLITVMQRAQYYSNKAREIHIHHRGQKNNNTRKTKEEEEGGAWRHFLATGRTRKNMKISYKLVWNQLFLYFLVAKAETSKEPYISTCFNANKK